MKSVLTLLCCALLGGAATAQTFVPPFYTETAFPDAASGAVFRPQHTSCYSMGDVLLAGTPGNLYLHSWNCAATATTSYNGIAWKRNDVSNTTTYDQGYLTKSGVIYDLEVGLISTSYQTYVIASYWNGGGCYYDIYKWEPTGLIASSLNNLISATGTDIRMDSHKSYGLALTWKDTDGIRVKVFNTGVVNTLQIGDNKLITNTANCSKPDIAFTHPGTSDLAIRVAYVNPAGDVYVMNKNFNTVLGTTFPSIMFNQDDVQYGVNPSELDLDCPDHFSEDNWSYIYRQGNLMKARLKTVSFSATPFTINLSNGALNNVTNSAPTLAYANDGLSIYYGWYTPYTASPMPGYVAVERSTNGNYITPLGSYNRVANTSDFGGLSLLSFSKQNDQSPSLFAAYSMYFSTTTGQYEIRSKLVPWTATSFRPGATGIKEEQGHSGSMMAFPNPFRNDFSLNIDADNGTQSYAIELLNIQGSLLRSCKGNLKQINRELSAFSQKLGSGIYLIRNNTPGAIQTLKVVKAR